MGMSAKDEYLLHLLFNAPDSVPHSMGTEVAINT